MSTQRKLASRPQLKGPPNLAIRAKPPSPRRLSRKVLVAGMLLAGAIVAFALVNGLSERPDRRAAIAQQVAASGGPPESIQRRQRPVRRA
jgi:hypothetical protein